MYRNIIIPIISAVLAFMAAGCSIASGAKPVETQEFMMGTIITQKVYGSSARAAADEAAARLKEIESRMTVNSPGSEMDKLNENSGKSMVHLSSDVIYVLGKAQDYAALSGGAFDVTVGPLVKAWGIFTDNPRIPGDDEISRLLRLVDYKRLEVDSANNTAYLGMPGQIADLGGIAKGYAGDEVIRIYKKYGIKSAYVNLGGNVVALGNKPDGGKWRIGIQDPRSVNGDYMGTIEISDCAVVTSGDYERYFEKDGVRYHHILDPKTGRPSGSGLISATIVAPVSVDADALSTAVFVLGKERGMELVESLDGIEAILIASDKKVYVSDGLKGNFKISDASKGYEYAEKG